MTITDMTLKVVKQTLKAVDDINEASTSQTIPLHLPARNGYLAHIFARVKTAFAGVTLPQISIGDADDTDNLMPLQPLDTIKNLITGASINSAAFCDKLQEVTNSNPNFIITISSQSGNLSALTAGELEIVLIYAY